MTFRFLSPALIELTEAARIYRRSGRRARPDSELP